MAANGRDGKLSAGRLPARKFVIGHQSLEEGCPSLSSDITAGMGRHNHNSMLEWLISRKRIIMSAGHFLISIPFFLPPYLSYSGLSAGQYLSHTVLEYSLLPSKLLSSALRYSGTPADGHRTQN